MSKHVLPSLGPSKILVPKFDLNINNVGYHLQCLNQEQKLSFSKGTGIIYYLN